MSKLVRSVVGAAGLRPLTPTAGDGPASKRQRKPELKTREEAIAIIRDKTGRLVPPLHQNFVKEHSEIGARVWKMTAKELDDERDLFLNDVQRRWEKKMRQGYDEGLMDKEEYRTQVEAGDPSYRDPRRATVRESQRESARRRYAEDIERQRKRDQAAFWKNKGSPEDIKRKLQLPLGHELSEAHRHRRGWSEKGTRVHAKQETWREAENRKIQQKRERREKAGPQPVGGGRLPELHRQRAGLSKYPAIVATATEKILEREKRISAERLKAKKRQETELGGHQLPGEQRHRRGWSEKGTREAAEPEIRGTAKAR